jgi:ferredoxin-NADP reductase
VGGFTITSPPQTAFSLPSPYIELAIQASSNPPAAYLWQPAPSILDSAKSFRIGGNFAYPPLSMTKAECESIDRVVFVAGGVGINPIMSMLSAMDAVGQGRLGGVPKDVRVLYTSRRSKDEQGEGERILFEERLRGLAEKWKQDQNVNWTYTLFETQKPSSQPEVAEQTMKQYRRITEKDLLEAIGPEEQRSNTVVYVCGAPQMTDEFVAFLQNQPGMDEKRVLCEKWW